MVNADTKKFASLIRRSDKFQPRRCACGMPATIKIYYAVYGPNGVRVECTECENRTQFFGITEFVACGSVAGTPVTEKALIRGIKKAVKEWNFLAAERITNEFKQKEQLYSIRHSI